MRVISGKARGHKLFAPDGLHTRPTADRIKESIFNILIDYTYDASFLDLYSGSGAIGIEALSRGASRAVFVDNDSESIKTINKNLEKTKLLDSSEVIKGDVSSSILQLKQRYNKFDIIFMDPPYNTDCADKSILDVYKNDILADDGIMVVEIDKNQNLDKNSLFGFEIFKIKDYNIAKIVFLRKGQS